MSERKVEQVEPRYFFVPDRDNQTCGWICVWEYSDNARTAKPLDYIKASLWSGLRP